MLLDKKTTQEFGYSFETAGSTKSIYLQCDYCGKEFLRAKRHILQLNSIVDKDSCGDKSCTVQKREDATRAKHGDNCFQEAFLEKAKKTNLKRYGVDNPAKSEIVKDKIKKTNLRKYGCESYLSTKEKQIKSIKTSRNKYNTDFPSQSEEIKNKIQDTCLKRYGQSSHHTEEWKEIVKKSVQKKYGVASVMQLKDVKEKQQDAVLKNFGVKHPLQNQEIKEKFISTCIEKYGVSNYSQTEEYKEKYKQTCMKKYGVPHPMMNEDIKINALQNKIDKYGVLYANLGAGERDLGAYLKECTGLDFSPNVQILRGKEIDLFNEEMKLGFEYCGLYWHTELSKEPRKRSYHYKKYKQCKDAGIRLITVFEDEWTQRNHQSKGVIKSICSDYDKKIPARKCKIENIDKNTGSVFLEVNHLMGISSNAIKFLGLTFEDSLVGLLVLGRHHRQKGAKTITRLCFKSGVQIIGGVSKLLKACKQYCKDNDISELVTWSDNRWSEGNVYEKTGFSLDAELPPDYSYVNLKSSKKRISKQSQKKSKTGCPSTQTEREWCAEHDLARIWDCGKKRWKLIID